MLIPRIISVIPACRLHTSALQAPADDAQLIDLYTPV